MLPHRSHHFPQILFVIGVAAVFIFYLHHYNRTALGDLQILHLWKQMGEITSDFFHKWGIIKPKPHHRILQQPIRQSPKFPLRTNIRCWSQNDIKPYFLCRLDKSPQIKDPIKLIDTFLCFMKIPRNIGFDGIAAHQA